MDLFIYLLTLVFVLQWSSLHYKISIMSFSQFPLTFLQIHMGLLLFIGEMGMVGLLYIILHHKYQSNPLLSPWFLAACVPSFHNRENLRCLILRLIKQGSVSHPKTLVLTNFDKLLMVISKTLDLLFQLYLLACRCCIFYPMRQSYFLKSFLLGILILNT